jgi:hypothetical protein
VTKVQTLIEKGSNLDHLNGTGTTAVELAVGWGGQYDIALDLLSAGASFRIYVPRENTRLIHRVVEEERRLPHCTPKQRADYQKLLNWLVEHGESVEAARADMKRWASWSQTTGEFRRKMDAEVAARIAREAEEKKAVEPAGDKKE